MLGACSERMNLRERPEQWVEDIHGRTAEMLARIARDPERPNDVLIVEALIESDGAGPTVCYALPDGTTDARAMEIAKVEAMVRIREWHRKKVLNQAPA